MTVDELIQLLAHSTDLRVVVKGYEGGCDDLPSEQLSLVKMALKTGRHRWEGQHGNLNGSTDDVVERWVLRRLSS